ncbi:hypothetical protein [uncultured Rikenella sp.]|uniref:hypothetical protein n=1 Tax=uncultured Rikenella sp. TaxID=368003 RepID=UPI0026363ADC|nr:hypothetical protein [uncultured Rikenella sp.]
MNTLPIDRKTGIPCPDCGTLIPVTISDLLGPSGNFTCSNCGRKLSLMRRESAQALNELQKVQAAWRNLDKKSHVNL